MTLNARALATTASRPCRRLDEAAKSGWSDTGLAAHHGHTAKNPRLAYAYGKAYEDRITTDHAKLRDLIGADPGTAHECTAEHGDSASHQAFLNLLDDPQNTLILQGIVPGPYGGWLRPDLLYRRNGTWTVGEIKIYLDKGGETDAHAFGKAVTQAAITVKALTDAGYTASAEVTIILTNLIGRPVTRTVDATGELELLARLDERAPYQGESDTPPDLAHIENIYSIRCHGACALADHCRALAQSNGNPFPTLDLHTQARTTPQQLVELAAIAGTVINSGYHAAVALDRKGQPE